MAKSYNELPQVFQFKSQTGKSGTREGTSLNFLDLEIAPERFLKSYSDFTN